MFDFLNGFHERMEFIAVVDSIVNRKNKNSEIEALFGEHELDNIIVSVLVYIMEKSLTEDEDCTIDGVAAFLKDILPAYGKRFWGDENEQLARYIIKDILQNKGESRVYNAMEYEAGAKQVRVRLITDKLNEDNKVVFRLSDQGYNFLFRTKEVDKELGFTMEELKLRELIKRKNFKKAVAQSRELIRMLVSKRGDIKRFETNIKNSIRSIEVAEYERLINETHGILEQEYDIMDEIRNMIKLSQDRLMEEETARGYLDNDMRAVKAEIALISKNIGTTINHQRNLILETANLKKLYLEILKDALIHNTIKRYNFEEELLKRIETGGDIDGAEKLLNISKRLLKPLFLPELDKSLSLMRVYDRQSKLREEQEESTGYSEEAIAIDDNIIKAERKNSAYINLLKEVFIFAEKSDNNFTLSKLIETLKHQHELDAMIEDRLFFTAMLKLYEYQFIDIPSWKASTEEIVTEGNGEFDLSYCLYNIEKVQPDFYGIKRLELYKLDDIIEVETKKVSGEMTICEKISMNDLFFEVSRIEKSTEDI